MLCWLFLKWIKKNNIDIWSTGGTETIFCFLWQATKKSCTGLKKHSPTAQRVLYKEANFYFLLHYLERETWMMHKNFQITHSIMNQKAKISSWTIPKFTASSKKTTKNINHMFSMVNTNHYKLCDKLINQGPSELQRTSHLVNSTGKTH